MSPRVSAAVGVVTVLTLFGLPHPAFAADWEQSWNGWEVEYGEPRFEAASSDSAVELRGGFGVLGIEAREHVFAASGSTNNASLLIWQSLAPMGTLELKASLPEDFTVKAGLRAAIAGYGYMEDFDWIGPDFVSYGADDWTHLSQHSNTHLDWYFDGSLAFGRDIYVDPVAKLNANIGLKYTDVQWTAVGGTFVYSDFPGDAGGNFRAYQGSIPDEPTITYRQQLPVLFAGLDAEAKEGPWTFEGSVQGGVTFLGLATDHHWMRTPPMRIYDYLQPAPVLGASGTLKYDVTQNFGLFASGSVEQVFLGRSNKEYYDIDTGDLLLTHPDGGGAELLTVSASAGLKGSF